MIFSWGNEQTIFKDDISYKNNIGTLLKHDIDILFISRSSKSYYLNFLIDEDEEKKFYRYLYIPISEMKLRALVTGGVTLYECLNIEEVIVYDLYHNFELFRCFCTKFDSIDEEALPEKEEFLPPISESIINKLFKFDTGELCFILSGNKVSNHTISFDKLSKFLIASQKLASDSTYFYCEENSINKPSSVELLVQAQNAASFAVTTIAKDSVTVTALEETMSTYTHKLLTLDTKEIYELLDNIPIYFAKSLFAFYNVVLSNKYESIVKTKKKSFYLNTEKIRQIKSRVNDAKYIREEPVETKKGYLVGANIKTRYFYFIDDETGESFRGKISEDYEEEFHKITLDDKKIRIAHFKKLVEFKFNDFVQSYELIDLK